MHVYHNHDPFSKGSLTIERRSCIVRELWRHIAAVSRAAQPAVVLGGVFNPTTVQWAMAFITIKGDSRVQEDNAGMYQ